MSDSPPSPSVPDPTPVPLDELSSASVRELEAKALELRKLLRKKKGEVFAAQADNQRSYVGVNVYTEKMQARAETRFERLLLEEEAIRSDLSAVEAEIRDRREAARQTQDRWIQGVTLFVAIVATVATAVQAWVMVRPVPAPPAPVAPKLELSCPAPPPARPCGVPW